MSSPDDRASPVQPERRLEVDDSLRPRGLDLPTAAVFLAAGRAFVELVAAVPADAWDRPALGEWDVRALVGHTGRALTTLAEYAAAPTELPAELPNAEAYIAAGTRAPHRDTLNESVRQRGVQAGEQLGEHPAATVQSWLERARLALAAVDADPVVVTALGRMRVSAYLPTRTFELVVHGLDLAAALDLPPTVPDHALRAAAELAAGLAVGAGHGPTLVRALTGRGALAPGFSIVL